MSEEQIQQDELTTLKARADRMGVKYHPSISVEKLRERVNAKINGTAVEDDEAPAPKAVKETEAQRRRRLRKDAERLVRVRVTNMNPNKREWEGEIITVANKFVGTHRKYVPFNAEEGYHIPNIIYKQLIARKCQIFVTVRDSRGNKTRKGKLINEFSIEVLPNLTKAELDDLAKRQAMAGGLDDAA